ncbi:fusion protein [Agrobacterium salinitolerans]|uniref:fusion protein n=1 Tax=Agrobacterium salinitolerans TaxID=1183413 RepID=UPI0022B84008|nr:fusion protein [Agrobacterium salinitolerans]MCZ7887132.1 fusion protein [Agrobacterium salinitolerans]
MANTTWYGDGTATVAVGSRTVMGTDTGWLTEVAGLTPIKVGDKFGIHVGRPIVIEQIISDTELLLADDWPGPAQTDAPYKVELTSPTIAAVEAMRRLLASLSNGNLDSLSEITVGTDDIPIGIGPGVFGTVKKSELKDGVQFDEAVDDLAGRAAYDGAAADFRVLVADTGDGRSAVYIKESATSGDWSVPYYITGPVGPAGVNQRGNYSAGTAYAIRDIVQYGGSTWIAKVATTGNAPPSLPTTENTQWLLFARSGTAGVVDRGTYSGATAYEANDIVLNNGSTWLALQPTTGNAPPTLPTESNAYWRLFARKGNDGTGTGDVVGPAGGVAINDLAVFADTTGNLLKKAPNNVVGNALLSQMTAPAIKGRLTAGAGDVEDLTPAQARQVLGGWEFIGSFALAGLTQVDITGLGAYRSLRISGSCVMPDDTGYFIRFSSDNGATFGADADEFRYTITDASTSATSDTLTDGTLDGLPFLAHSGTTPRPAVGVLTICHFNAARNSASIGQAREESSGAGRRIRIPATVHKRAVAMNAVRLLSRSGSATQYGFLDVEGLRS